MANKISCHILLLAFPAGKRITLKLTGPFQVSFCLVVSHINTKCQYQAFSCRNFFGVELAFTDIIKKSLGI